MTRHIEGFAGQVLQQGDPDYEQARHVWNADIDRHPSLIARCTSTADVVAAVGFAQREGLEIAVRGGGHSLAGLSTVDDGILIDLSPMKAIDVDPARRTAEAGPGVLWRDFDAATQVHGLATTGGEVSDTGVAGLTLGGGFGWLKRTCGLACDNLLEVDLVTADGRVVRASADEHPELFWGLRGGGGNFGIVTRFVFRLHPVGPVLFGGPLLYPLDRAHDVLRLLRESAASAPDEVSFACAMVTAPPAPFVPSHLQGSPVIVLSAAWFGAIEDGPAALADVRTAVTPVADLIGPVPYVELQQSVDAANPRGMHSYARAEWLAGLSDDTIASLVAYAAVPSSPMNQILVHPMGGAVARVDPDTTAFAYRTAAHSLTVVAMWQPGDPDRERHITWAREAWQSARTDSAGGAYVNHLLEEGDQRVREAYGDSTFQRLTELKAVWDPDNVFRRNQNIPPRPSLSPTSG